MPVRPLIAVIAVLALAGAAQAQPSRSAAAKAPAPDTPVVVAGVAVIATDPPQVVATFPASDAEVAPGVLVLKIVFDQTMTPDSWNYAKTAAGDYPSCLGTPRLLADGKTFVLLCTAAAGKRYGVAINMVEPGDEAKAFVNAGDRRSPPFELAFSTRIGDPVRTVKDAMKAAGLGGLDMPVESMGAFVRPAALP